MFSLFASTSLTQHITQYIEGVKYNHTVQVYVLNILNNPCINMQAIMSMQNT